MILYVRRAGIFYPRPGVIIIVGGYRKRHREIEKKQNPRTVGEGWYSFTQLHHLTLALRWARYAFETRLKTRWCRALLLNAYRQYIAAAQYLRHWHERDEDVVTAAISCMRPTVKFPGQSTYSAATAITCARAAVPGPGSDTFSCVRIAVRYCADARESNDPLTAVKTANK